MTCLRSLAPLPINASAVSISQRLVPLVSRVQVQPVETIRKPDFSCSSADKYTLPVWHFDAAQNSGRRPFHHSSRPLDCAKRRVVLSGGSNATPPA
jgi:hypothetical protein